MTLLFRPVLIETAEQAEALPDGTVVRHDDYMPVERWHHDGVGYWDNCEFPPTSADLVGRTALVPVEAEVERQAIVGCEIGVPGSEQITHEHRYVTPWEEA